MDAKPLTPNELLDFCSKLSDSGLIVLAWPGDLGTLVQILPPPNDEKTGGVMPITLWIPDAESEVILDNLTEYRNGELPVKDWFATLRKYQFNPKVVAMGGKAEWVTDEQ